MKEMLSSVAAGLVSLVLFSGCASQHVKMHEVTTVVTKDSQVIQVSEVPYRAIEEVIERSPNVKSVTRMTDLKGEREPGFFCIAKDGKSLVFQAYESKQQGPYFNLWRMSTMGSAAMTQLTAGRYFDMEPAFGADSSIVYFASTRSTVLPKLWRIQVDGAGGITRITQGDSEDRIPSAAPDTNTIYYASRPPNASTWQIWRVGANGTLATQLREGFWPSASPDGTRILYSAYDLKILRWRIWVMGVDGTGQTQLTMDPSANCMYPSWSPDGRKVLFASDAGKDSNGNKNYDVWMMKIDGSDLTQLTTNGSTDFMPRFSPDGRYIYFVSNRGMNWDIWRIEI